MNDGLPGSTTNIEYLSVDEILDRYGENLTECQIEKIIKISKNMGTNSVDKKPTEITTEDVIRIAKELEIIEKAKLNGCIVIPNNGGLEVYEIEKERLEYYLHIETMYQKQVKENNL